LSQVDKYIRNLHLCCTGTRSALLCGVG
jgi:hypothetical protein